jgi:hypothetical protein
MSPVSRRAFVAAAGACAVASVASGAASTFTSRFGVMPSRGEFDRMGQWHARFLGGTRWRVRQLGLEIEGDLLSPVEDAQADAVLRAMAWFRPEILHAAIEFNVPVDLLLSTLSVETVAGVQSREQSVRARGSSGEVGAMQILPATARAAMGEPRMSIAALQDPLTNVRAGAAYIALQSKGTRFDPPLVAAAYNAGGVYEEQSARNPWRMRCWPLGTGGYVTKQAGYFNAATDMLRGDPGLARFAPTWAKAHKDAA